MIAADLALALGSDLGYGTVDEITADIAAKVAGFHDVTPEALAGAADGIVAVAPTTIDPMNHVEVSLAERNSYDFRLVVSRKLYDRAAGTAHSPSLAHLAPGSAVHLHPLDLERVGTRDGTEVKVSSARASLVFTAIADASVRRGTAWVPFNQPGPNVGDLIDCFAAVNDVRIENL